MTRACASDSVNETEISAIVTGRSGNEKMRHLILLITRGVPQHG